MHLLICETIYYAVQTTAHLKNNERESGIASVEHSSIWEGCWSTPLKLKIFQVSLKTDQWVSAWTTFPPDCHFNHQVLPAYVEQFLTHYAYSLQFNFNEMFSQYYWYVNATCKNIIIYLQTQYRLWKFNLTLSTKLFAHKQTSKQIARSHYCFDVLRDVSKMRNIKQLMISSSSITTNWIATCGLKTTAAQLSYSNNQCRKLQQKRIGLAYLVYMW